MISQITTFQSDIQSVHVVQPSTEHDKVSLWPGIISRQVFSYTNDKVNHHNVSQSFNGQVQDISFFQWSILVNNLNIMSLLASADHNFFPQKDKEAQDDKFC